uniref:Exocyst complex component Sec8 n=1 Tax=Anisakis simplex TaxID=6269 RepID=A0A0M3JUM6_ANISI
LSRTVDKVKHFAKEVRKDCQHSISRVNAFENALKTSGIIINEGITSLNDLISKATSDFDANLCELEAAWKQTLNNTKQDSMSLLKSTYEQKSEINEVAEEYIEVAKLINDMQSNFRLVAVLLHDFMRAPPFYTFECCLLDDRVTQLRGLMRPSNALQRVSSQETSTQQSDNSSMICAELLLLIRRLMEAQTILGVVQLDEHPQPSEIVSLIEKAQAIKLLISPNESCGSSEPFETDYD